MFIAILTLLSKDSCSLFEVYRKVAVPAAPATRVTSISTVHFVHRDQIDSTKWPLRVLDSLVSSIPDDAESSSCRCSSMSTERSGSVLADMVEIFLWTNAISDWMKYEEVSETTFMMQVPRKKIRDALPPISSNRTWCREELDCPFCGIVNEQKEYRNDSWMSHKEQWRFSQCMLGRSEKRLEVGLLLHHAKARENRRESPWICSIWEEPPRLDEP